MRRTRALGVFGLVLGLSGCAGTHHQYHFPALGGVGSAPGGASCGCRTAAVPSPVGTGTVASHGGGSGTAAGVGAGLSTSAAVATVAARPGALAAVMLPVPRPSLPAASAGPRSATAPVAATAWSTASHASASAMPSPPSWTPPGSLPVPVPAPAPVGVTRHYFPTPGGEEVRNVLDPVPPDLLGVRTSMAPAAGSGLGPAASASRSPSPLSQEELGSLSLAPSETGDSRPHIASRASTLNRDVVPVSAEISPAPGQSDGLMPPTGTVDLPLAGPDLAVGDATASPPKTLVLEHAEPADLAGRPRLASATTTEPPLVPRDQDGPSTWVSALAFEQAKPKAGSGTRILPMLRGDARPDPTPQPRRQTVLSRFVRRVRVAGRAFLDPDSVGRKPGDLAERGQGVERVSTDRIGESSKR